MPQAVARKPLNLLEMLARNPRGWGMSGAASPEEGVADPNMLDRGRNALRAFGPVAEMVAPNLLQMATNPRGTVQAQGEEFATEAPFMVAGPPGRVGRMGLTAARAIGLPAMLGLTAAPTAAGAKERKAKAADGGSEEVKKLQLKMRDAGLYSGPIDGRLDPDGPTMKAKEKFDKLEADRERRETERKKIEAGEKETQRLATESARKTKEREEGAKRLRELDKDKSGFWDSYGTPLGYAAGALVGGLSRGGAAYFTNRAARKSANELSALVSGGGDLPSRVGGVNTFWQRGGAPDLPFNPAPKGRYGFTSNKQAPSAPTLYNEKPGNKYARAGDYGAMGIFGAEMGVSEWQKIGARDELRQAREAVSADPSEPNIRRMKAAEDEYSFWEGMANAGRGAMGGYGGVGKFATYKNPRPNAAAADAERIRIDNIIHQARPIRAKRKK